MNDLLPKQVDMMDLDTVAKCHKEIIRLNNLAFMRPFSNPPVAWKLKCDQVEIENAKLRDTIATKDRELQMPQWMPIETRPTEEEYGSFLVLLPKNDVAPFVVLQVSNFEGRMYPDARDACIDWEDGITTATHWQPLPQPPRKDY